MAVRVELDVFSGRPNPVWMLDEDGGVELRRRIDLLPHCDAPWEQAPALGYRGFCFTLAEARCRVFHTILQVSDTQHLSDPSRTVETFLIGTLPPKWADLRERIEGLGIVATVIP